jgi:hypothetical protein
MERASILPWVILTAIGIVLATLLLQLKPPPASPAAALNGPAFQTQPPVAVPLPFIQGFPAHSAASAPSPHPLPLDQTMALIHSKLLEWSHRKTGDRDTDDRLMNELAALLTDDNASKIIKLLSPEELQGPFGTAALFRWMKTDPLTAVNWVASRPDATDDQAWIVAHGLLAEGIDPQKFATQLPETNWKQTYLLDAGLDDVSANPNQVIALAREMGPGGTQTNLLQTAVNEWMGTDPDSTMNWIMSIGDPALRDNLISAGAKACAASDPRRAVAWALSAMSPGDTLDSTILSIVNNWSSANPGDASAWAAQLPDGPVRTTALKAVLSQWLQSNPGAATAWARTLPDGGNFLANP